MFGRAKFAKRACRKKRLALKRAVVSEPSKIFFFSCAYAHTAVTSFGRRKSFSSELEKE